MIPSWYARGIMIPHSGLFDFIEPKKSTTNASALKPIQGPPPALERVDDVVGGDGPAMGVLRVGDGVADDVGEEVLEHRAGLLVHQAGQTLHPTAAREAANGGTGDALDVVAKDLAVALGSALAEALAAFALAKHWSEH
jgi:hypothetical protein